MKNYKNLKKAEAKANEIFKSLEIPLGKGVAIEATMHRAEENIHFNKLTEKQKEKARGGYNMQVTVHPNFFWAITSLAHQGIIIGTEKPQFAVARFSN